MKQARILLLIITYFLGASQLMAERSVLHRVLDWQPIHFWESDSVTTPVISFHNATYPNSDFLPYLMFEYAANTSLSLENPIYVSPTQAECALLQNKDIPTILHTKSYLQNDRGVQSGVFYVLPFIKNGTGEILKLSSFSLVKQSVSLPRKTAEASLHTYADNSVLQTGRFVKIAVQQSGIYRLTYEDLQGMGVNPANARVFGYGGAVLEQSFLLPKNDDLPEVSVYMNKGSDGVFGAGDYILFYAQGVTSWKYESSIKTFTHQQNTYSDYGYYFVSSDAGVGNKIALSDETLVATDAHQVTVFQDYQVHEKDLINLVDVQGSDGAGREFYGETFFQPRSYDFSFSFPNIDKATPLIAKLNVATRLSNATTYFDLTHADVKQTLSVGNFAATGKYQFTPSSDNLTFRLAHRVSDVSTCGYLNYLQLNVQRNLTMSGAALFFRNVENIGSTQNSLYKLAEAGSDVKIWNITNPTCPVEMPVNKNGTSLEFVATNSTLQQFVACDISKANTFPKPTVIGEVASQNLHALSDIDYVILTHPDFISQANVLAEVHRVNNNLTVAVVTPQQVYNEFSSGTPDATAYRWLMKMLYDRAAQGLGTAPKYLLLLGDGTFDNRKKLINSGSNKILTYQAENSIDEISAYVTDDYFAYLDNNEGLSDVRAKMDIAVGRFPVTTQQQATDLVQKTIRYMTDENKGNWKNQLCFLGDDGDDGTHMIQVNEIADYVLANNPSYVVNKIYLDAYIQQTTASGEQYPMAEAKLDNLLQKGLLYFVYMGHGNPSYLSNEMILTTNEIKKMKNTNMAFWAFGTCSFGKFDSQSPSGAEESVLNPNAAAVGMLTAARTVYAPLNKTLLKNLSGKLFEKQADGNHVSIGEAIRLAKNMSTSTGINRLSYIYMGDPAIVLNFADEYNVTTTKINGEDVAKTDTLNALSIATVEGEVCTSDGSVASNFNGKVHILIRDKSHVIVTQDNHNELETASHFQYIDRTASLFNGKVNVENGTFKLTFMVPKDIKYNYGKGDINYYAYDEQTGDEAIGNFSNFVVGGGTNMEFDDVEGPQMKIYLNTPEFKSTEKVNETPVFFAELSDENGINSVGSGIGHDLKLTLNNDPYTSYVLNDQFVTTENDYTSGLVRYTLPELPQGKHVLSFRAWDLLNNSTTHEIEFEVVEDLKMKILSVSSYPNPVRVGQNVRIVVMHDRPDDILETTVHLFDLSGRLIQTKVEPNANDIVWDLADIQLSQGMYLYQVKVKTTDEEFVSLTNKIMVVGQ